MLTDKEYKLIMMALETHRRSLIDEKIKFKVEQQIEKIKEKLKSVLTK